MIFPSDLKAYVIRPALARLSLSGTPMASLSSESLILGTIMHESVSGAIQRLVQTGGGPALGIAQVEPITGHDIVDRWLAAPSRAALRDATRGMTTAEPLEQQLISNLSLVVCVVRFKYAMDPQALPAATDAEGMARTYKRVYNSAAGAAVVGQQLISTFKAAIAA